MFNFIKNIGNGLKIFNPLPKLGIKCIKTFIDSKFREKVVPIKGSVLYSDLYLGAEHSGIYIGNNEISNIVVKSFAESMVERSSPEEFTDSSYLHTNIYVSCDSKGPVGDEDVCREAINHLGERGFYGLLFKNCHEFSEKCVDSSKKNFSKFFNFELSDVDETWERTIKNLKAKSRKKLGATKWKLWDWKNQPAEEETPDIKKMESYWKNLALNEKNIEVLRNELNHSYEYSEEISDENLPKEALEILENFKGLLEKIEKKYNEVEKFIKLMGCNYSYNDFEKMGEDFLALVKEMENNPQIKEIIKKLGRNYISSEKKLKGRVLKRNNNEVLGIHKSDDIIRILPSELANFESEELEYLFYSKFFEKSLLTYELLSKEYEDKSKLKQEYVQVKNRGPMIACIDTSGSMNGIPILKAKALLLAISKIMKKEKRALYILLFGDKEEIRELNVYDKSEVHKILSFLNSSFNGGTDFETPLKRGIEIIKEIKSYNKADILLITDGYCEISDEYIKKLNMEKIALDFSIYTIICGENKIKDRYSDGVINI